MFAVRKEFVYMRNFNHLSKKKGNQTNTNKGFSLIELIIVVAIMAVLVVVCAPMYTKYIHKSRVARDWANLKIYYDEIQADFISTGEYNPKVKLVDHYSGDISNWKQTEIASLDGNTVKMQAGYFAVTKDSSGNGYQIVYYCDKVADGNHYETCSLTLGTR